MKPETLSAQDFIETHSATITAALEKRIETMQEMADNLEKELKAAQDDKSIWEIMEASWVTVNGRKQMVVIFKDQAERARKALEDLYELGLEI